MYEEDDTIKLISSTKSDDESRSRSKRYGRDDRQVFYLSDSELANQYSMSEYEETTVFSDTLYGDSLPSMRAQLAKAKILNRTKRTVEATTTMMEDSSLLTKDEREGKSSADLGEFLDEKETSDKDYGSLSKGDYRSLGSSITSRKRGMREKMMRYYNHSKVAILSIFLIVCVILFAINKEHEEEYHYVSLGSNQQIRSINFTGDEIKSWKFITMEIEGPFLDNPYSEHTDSCSNHIFVCGTPRGYDNQADPCPSHEDSSCHSFELTSGFNGSHAHNDYITITKTFKLDTDFSVTTAEEGNVSFVIDFMTTMSESMVEFKAAIIGEKLEEYIQTIIAGVILVWVYVLIAFDIVHRTMAAFIGSTCTLAVLSMIDQRPTLDRVVEWIDLDTICLLFGMMTLVAIFSQTGFFDYSAVKAYKIARGKVWPLISLLCLFSAVVSAFLDNVTTVLLLTPVSIRLCQVLNLDPRPILIAEVVFSNIGGTATAIGDPPNVIIVSNSLIRSAGIDFPEFTLHLFLGVLFAMVAAYGLLALIYRVSFIHVKNKDPAHIAELKREIAIWERTAQHMNVVALEERAVHDAILAKAMDVRNQLNQEISTNMHSSKDLWQKNLAELESKYKITNWILLTKSSAVLLVVIFMFFMSNIIPKVELDLGWIAIFGGVVLIILADIQELESILHKIEWGTLLFFAGLFVLMEGLGELGLIRFIGEVMVWIIEKMPEENQMFVAIILILWVSAIASSFIDNIPFTTATIPVIWELAHSPHLCLSLRPLVWALAFGACLGGNGTLIGASANVVCAGIAEQNGYKISFMNFFKIGFPMMLVTTLATTFYLFFCHSGYVGINWNTGEALQCVRDAAANSTI